MITSRTGGLTSVLAAIAPAILVAACSQEAATPRVAPADTYSIALTASTVAGLPKCTASLAGTTAYVQMPVSLYSCQSGSWVQICCPTLGAGAVAYASASQTLLACVAGQWTPVPLPAGAQGATGAQGDAGPMGATGAPGPSGMNGFNSLVTVSPLAAGSADCPTGGQAIHVGLDLDRDGKLSSDETTSTAIVCSGPAMVPQPDASPPPAPDAGVEMPPMPAPDGGTGDATVTAGGPTLLMLACTDDLLTGGTFEGTAWSMQQIGFASCHGGGAALTVTPTGSGVGVLGGSPGQPTFTTWTSGMWTPPAPVATNSMGAPALAPTLNGAILVSRGSDFHYYQTMFTGGVFGSGSPVGPVAFGGNSPGAASTSKGVTLAFTDQQNQLAVSDLIGGVWTTPSPIAPIANINAPKVVALSSAGGADLMAAAILSQGVGTFVRVDGVWSPTAPVPFGVVGVQRVALAGLKDGGALLVATGLDQKLYWSTFSAGAWSVVQAIPFDGFAALDESAVALSAGLYGDVAEMVFMTDRQRSAPTQGHVFHTRLTAAGWSPPAALAVPGATFAVALAAWPGSP